MSDNRQSANNTEAKEIMAAKPQECPHCGSTDSNLAPAIAPNDKEASQEETPLNTRASTASQIALNSEMKSANRNTLWLTASQQALSIASAGEGLSKWEQDTFRDILNNANNTLRFQVQLAVPLLAGCVTALNIIPPQAHQELLNLLDRWVFIPVLLSMGAAYYGLEMHWTVKPGKILDNVESLTKLIRRKYDLVHLAIVLQATGLILLMVFVLLEYK